MREHKCDKLFAASGKFYYTQSAEHAVQQTLSQRGFVQRGFLYAWKQTRIIVSRGKLGYTLSVKHTALAYEVFDAYFCANILNGALYSVHILF
jgi:hypothetical protein